MKKTFILLLIVLNINLIMAVSSSHVAIMGSSSIYGGSHSIEQNNGKNIINYYCNEKGYDYGKMYIDNEGNMKIECYDYSLLQKSSFIIFLLIVIIFLIKAMGLILNFKKNEKEREGFY